MRLSVTAGIAAAPAPAIRRGYGCRESRREQHHRQDEQDRDAAAVIQVRELGDEQQCHNDADRDRTRHAQEHCVARKRDPPVQQPQFPDMPVMLGTTRIGVQPLEHARAIHHPVQASGNHVHEPADARQQEHRRDSQLDCPRNVRDSGRYTHFGFLNRSVMRSVLPRTAGSKTFLL
jgi:hypothetical protein